MPDVRNLRPPLLDDRPGIGWTRLTSVPPAAGHRWRSNGRGAVVAWWPPTPHRHSSDVGPGAAGPRQRRRSRRLMIEGQGAPEGTEFSSAVQVLYAVSYAALSRCASKMGRRRG